MNSVTIDAEVSPDRKLIYTLPPDVPIGPVRLVIQAVEESSNYPLSRDEVRQRLLAAGKLVTTSIVPANAVALSDDERERLARLFGSGPETTLDILNQERGPKA